MIWSVSTLLRRSGTPMPVWLVNLSISDLAPGRRASSSVPRIAVAAATGTETRWVRPPLPCRPSKLRLDVEALRSWGASWSGFMPRHIEQPAPRHSPPASLKIDVEALVLGLQPDPHRAGYDEQPGAVGDLAALDDLGGRAEVLDPAVGARADEDGVDLRSRASACRPRGPCTPAPSRAPTRSLSSSKSSGSGTDAAERHALARVGAPGDERRHRARVELDLLVELGVVVGDQRLPVRDRGVPVGALRRLGPALEVVERRLVRARSGRPWRPTRCSCCRPSSGPPSRAPRWPGRGTPRRTPGRRRCRCARSG